MMSLLIIVLIIAAMIMVYNYYFKGPTTYSMYRQYQHPQNEQQYTPPPVRHSLVRFEPVYEAEFLDHMVRRMREENYISVDQVAKIIGTK